LAALCPSAMAGSSSTTLPLALLLLARSKNKSTATFSDLCTTGDYQTITFSGNYDLAVHKVTPAGPGAAAGFTAGTAIWLTSTTEDEIFSAIAPWTNGNFLILFARKGATATVTYYLAVISSTGSFVVNPTEVSSVMAWGERPSLAYFADGSVGLTWAWNGSTYSNSCRIPLIHAYSLFSIV